MQGCFIGAETLSKLTNLDAVKQQLWGLQLSSSAAPGDLIMGMSRSQPATVVAKWLLHVMISCLCKMLHHQGSGPAKCILQCEDEMILQMAKRSVAKSQALQACPMVNMWPWDMCGAVAGASRWIWQESRYCPEYCSFHGSL